MIIDPFQRDDFAPFLKLATAENWMVDPWEFEFLLSAFPQGCCAARADGGELAGCVTSLKHGCSGWIGNLIVAEGFRGRGIGQELFVSALEALRAEGVETVWLTASKLGQALYEKHGFKSIDTIVRWSGTGRQRHIRRGAVANCGGHDTLLNEIDAQAWGDQRAALLAATVARGKLLQQPAGFAVLQPCGDALQIGPFSALEDATADDLLKAALQSAALGTKLYLDAPASNRAALRLFNRRGLRISGRTRLMYRGRKPDYRAEFLYGLASLGSCG